MSSGLSSDPGGERLDRRILAVAAVVGLLAGMTGLSSAENLMRDNTHIGLGGGGTAPPARANNTVILDAAEGAAPVVAGAYLVGTTGHLHFVNLSALAEHTLSNPLGFPVATLTPVSGAIHFYNVDLRIKGIWRLVQDPLAEPVVTFRVTDNVDGLDSGTFVQTLASTLPTTVDSTTLCRAEVSGGKGRFPQDQPTPQVHVPANGGHVELRMPWTSEIAPGERGHFLLLLGGPRPLPSNIVYQAAGANVSIKGETGLTVAIAYLLPDLTYRFFCHAWGTSDSDYRSNVREANIATSRSD